MRWALLAAEEVVGEKGLAIVLREAGLEQLVGNYPPNEDTTSFGLTFGDYASLFAGLLNFYGRAGKSMLLRVGRVSSKHAIEQQGALFNVAATAAIKVLPVQMQLRVGLENMQKGFRKMWQTFGVEFDVSLEDRGEKFAYVAPQCPMCAGLQADRAVCLSFTGSLQESARWLTGHDFQVDEVECRALGAPACVWEISKKRKE
jgi:predicted hydrocarbon binding protein